MNRVCLIIPAAALAVCPLALAQELVPLIPRQTLFGNPDRAGVQVSPDGTQISFLAAVDGVMNVWVGPLDDPSAAEPVTHDARRGISQYQWAYTNDRILYLQDQAGDENWSVYAVDLATKEARNLTPYEQVQARIVSVDEDTPTHIILAINNRNPELHDLHRVSILDGSSELIRECDPGVVGWVLDNDENPRFAVRFSPEGGQEWLRVEEDGSLRPSEAISPEDALTTAIAGFTGDNSAYYLQDSRGRNTGALFEVDAQSGQKRLLAENPSVDAGGLMINPRTKRVEAVSFNKYRSEWTVLDPAVKGDLATLARLGDGEVNVVSRSHDDRVWIVAMTDDNGPIKYYRYNRGEQPETKFLFNHRESLVGLPLVPMMPLDIKTRDGLSMVGFISLPPGVHYGLQGEPLPMVLLVHGGPWARDEWGYNPLHQLLANRGYGVLSVNFRGSTGFGKQFTNAGDREWGAKMHDDLIDAVNWTVAKGIAQKDRIAIMGGSYGGYATLVGLAFTPETFACGVDIVGPSNLITLMESIPAYWKPMMSMFTARVGDHSTPEGREFLTARSPLSFVDKITRPLLIGQGANDPRVKQAEADQIVSAMEKKGIPVTYVLFPDEGHGFVRPENRVAFYGITEAFLSRHLGGRYEPLSGVVEESSAQVITGADGVPGLAK